MQHMFSLPGSSAPTKSLPVVFLYQSRIRPTKGEMSVTPASAHATAYALIHHWHSFQIQLHICHRNNHEPTWAKEKSRVRLQWMPSASNILQTIQQKYLPQSKFSGHWHQQNFNKQHFKIVKTQPESFKCSSRKKELTHSKKKSTWNL